MSKKMRRNLFAQNCRFARATNFGALWRAPRAQFPIPETPTSPHTLTFLRRHTSYCPDTLPLATREYPQRQTMSAMTSNQDATTKRTSAGQDADQGESKKASVGDKACSSDAYEVNHTIQGPPLVSCRVGSGFSRRSGRARHTPLLRVEYCCMTRQTVSDSVYPLYPLVDHEG